MTLEAANALTAMVITDSTTISPTAMAICVPLNAPRAGAGAGAIGYAYAWGWATAVRATCGAPQRPQNGEPGGTIAPHRPQNLGATAIRRLPSSAREAASMRHAQLRMRGRRASSAPAGGT